MNRSGGILTPDFETLPELDDAIVARHGMGYRGIFGSIHLHLARLHSSRGELSGMLEVAHDERTLFKGRFNVASPTTRSGLAKHLRDRDRGYEGWGFILERFCWHVLTIEEEGPERQTVGDRPRRQRTPCLVDPILPAKSPTIIYGPGGSFKSTLAAVIAVSVQTGVSVLPGWTPVQGNVLILDWEASDDEWNDRISAIACGVGIAPPAIEYLPCGHRLIDLAEAISGTITQKNIALLIVDSVGLAQGTSSDGADASEATLRMFSALRMLGTTSLLIDHVRGEDLSNARSKTSKPYGSVYKTNLARSVFELRREEQQQLDNAAEIVLMHRKVNDGPPLGDQGMKVIHGETTILVQRCEVTAPDLEEHVGSTADRMARAVRNGALPEIELAELLSVSRAVVRKTMSRGHRFSRLPDGRIGLAAKEAL